MNIASSFFRKALTLGAALVLGLAAVVPAWAQDLDYDKVRALEEFQNGLGAYQNGQYNKAMLAFERSLALKPADQLTRTWLGNTLYASGLETQALSEWKSVAAAGFASDYLKSFMDVVSARRGLSREIQGPERYLPLFELNGKVKGANNRMTFLRPSSLRSLKNGGFLLVALGTEDILTVTPNGRIDFYFPGGIGGFKGPFDIQPVGDHYFVSEFSADQISVVNSWGVKTKSFGKKGRKDGEFLGPQYLATDGQALYVSDWGNSRVSKFDLEGNFLLSFGHRVPGFAGFKDPTGLTVQGSQLLVADKGAKKILAFDFSGNFLQEFGGPGVLTAPEGLSVTEDGRVLIADSTKVMVLDPATGQISAFDQEWDQGLKVTAAVLDENLNLLVTDFDGNLVRGLAPGSSIYSGLVVRVVRVVTVNYPEIFVEFTVEDRWGRPVIGLDASNFLISESGAVIQTFKTDFQGFKATDIEATLLVDRSPEAGRLLESFQDGVKRLSEGMEPAGGLWIVPVTDNPVPQNKKNSGILQNVQESTNPKTVTANGRLDQAIRLGANQLIPGLKKRGLFYLTTGQVPAKAFGRYELQEIAQFLKTNRVSFYVVQVGEGALSPDLDFLVKQTGGSVFNTREELGGLFTHLAGQRSGTYVVKYTSVTPSELGQRYIPMAVEVKHFKKTGRGESGFFGRKQPELRQDAPAAGHSGGGH